MSLLEWILSGALVCIVLLVLYFIFKERVDEYETDEEIYSLSHLCEEIKRLINDIVNMDVDYLRLNKKDLESRKELKRTLSNATRKCSQGNINEKEIVFFHIKNSLAGELNITEDVIDEVMPFNNPELLTAKDKYEIMMYLQKRENNPGMFKKISVETNLDRLKQDGRGYYYEITAEDIEQAYSKLWQPLSYDDKLNILTQRIYQETYGLGEVDLMIMEDESLDSISGGVSGITTDNYRYHEEDVYTGAGRKPHTYDSIYIVFDGKPIHLAFLSFGSAAGIIRVCKNLSEHGRTGHFTSSEGGIKTHLADGSRVTVFRPNNASQWAFFVRKFGSTRNYDLESLITDKGCEKPIGVMRWGMRGCINIIFSGDQNSGKTTNMRATVKEADRRQQIRTIEADFELYLNDAYYDMNILGTRPSKEMGFAKLIELLKASEAHTILFGETASLEHAKHLFDLLLAGTKRVITTGHWPTTDELISYFVLAQGGYGNAGTADIERVAARLLNLDIHHVRENGGHRYIDRITEIIPYEREEKEPVWESGIEGALEKIAYHLKAMVQKKSYYTRDIIVFENNAYHMINPISDGLAKMILRNLTPDERPLFMEFNKVSEKGGDEDC